MGITALLPGNMGKQAKIMDVPLVILSVKGSYLANPFWDEEHLRKLPIRVSLERIFTAEEIRKHSPEEIQIRVEKCLTYDDASIKNMDSCRFHAKAAGIRIAYVFISSVTTSFPLPASPMPPPVLRVLPP